MSEERQYGDILAELEHIAFCRPNDGVELVLAAGDVYAKAMELDGIAECKRGKDGVFEVKFFDRTRALELLYRLRQEEQPSNRASLLALLQGQEEGP